MSDHAVQSDHDHTKSGGRGFSSKKALVRRSGLTKGGARGVQRSGKHSYQIPGKLGLQGIERDTPVMALRLLLETGADPKRKDKRGNTAKDYAGKGKGGGREDALAIFEEFGC